MNYRLFTILIVFAFSLIAILLGGLAEKKGVPSKALVSFSRPDGSRAQGQIDVTWSWTVYVFGSWALVFRGQFMEFLMLFMSKLLLITVGVMTILVTSTGIDPTSSVAAAQEFAALDVVTVFQSMSIMQVVGWVALYGLFIGIRIYFIAYANKRRILMYHNRGMDLSQTPNLKELYDYAGIIPRKKPEDLAPNQRQGQAHTYVVPEKPIEEEDDNDYSNLTVQDLKLLLKSEGVPFPSSATKAQLLELVDEFIVEKAK